MASSPIQAVLFDMGGTIENLYSDDAIRQEATQGLRDLLYERGVDPGLSLPDLEATVLSGIQAYQAWKEKSEIELPSERVWTEYIFADHNLCKERLAAAADEISFFYETHYYVRSLRPEVPSALQSLHERGLRLAIISNTLSRQLVPRKLTEYGIAGHFEAVVTSASLGWRKPNERIFDEATRLMNLLPEACAYVGDTISRDVIGVRRAGFGLAILVRSFLTERSDRGAADVPADVVIQDLTEIAELVTLDREGTHGH